MRSRSIDSGSTKTVSGYYPAANASGVAGGVPWSATKTGTGTATIRLVGRYRIVGVTATGQTGSAFVAQIGNVGVADFVLATYSGASALTDVNCYFTITAVELT